jgi:hypothetical protein
MSLVIGDIIELAHEPHRVVMVNASRALVRPVAREVVEVCVTGGRRVKFRRLRRAFSISPNSEVPILKRFKNGRAA